MPLFTINGMSRRDFVKGMSFAAGYAMVSVKSTFARATAKPDENPPLFLLRAINTIELDYYYSHDNHWGDKEAVYGTTDSGLTGIKQCQQEMHDKGMHNSRGLSEATMNWAISLNLDRHTDEIMPGWKWDFALTRGYVVIVYGIPGEKGAEVPVYATDDDAVIYRAYLTEVPKASKLIHARWLPNSSAPE